MGRFFVAYSMMRLCLRPVVKAQDGLDGWGQIRGELDFTAAGPVLLPVVLIAVQLDLESFDHVPGCSLELHGSPLGRYFAHGEIVLFSKLFGLVDCAAIGAMLCSEFFA